MKLLRQLTRLLFIISLSLPLLLTSCGGGGGGGGGDKTVDTSSAAGVWLGTISDSFDNTVDLVCVYSSDGQYRIVVESGECPGTQYKGTFSLNGDNGSGNIKGYAADGCIFLGNGSPKNSGTFSFTVSGDNLSGTYSVQGDEGTFDLTYDPIAEVPVTLADYEGNWGNLSTFMTVLNDGSFSGSDEDCDFFGQITIIDPDFTITNISVTVVNCDDPSENGFVSGLGLLELDVGGDLLHVMVSDDDEAIYEELWRVP